VCNFIHTQWICVLEKSSSESWVNFSKEFCGNSVLSWENRESCRSLSAHEPYLISPVTYIVLILTGSPKRQWTAGLPSLSTLLTIYFYLSVCSASLPILRVPMLGLNQHREFVTRGTRAIESQTVSFQPSGDSAEAPIHVFKPLFFTGRNRNTNRRYRADSVDTRTLSNYKNASRDILKVAIPCSTLLQHFAKVVNVQLEQSEVARPWQCQSRSSCSLSRRWCTSRKWVGGCTASRETRIHSR